MCVCVCVCVCVCLYVCNWCITGSLAPPLPPNGILYFEFAVFSDLEREPIIQFLFLLLMILISYYDYYYNILLYTYVYRWIRYYNWWPNEPVSVLAGRRIVTFCSVSKTFARSMLLLLVCLPCTYYIDNRYFTHLCWKICIMSF
jgi:hypothetical protein